MWAEFKVGNLWHVQVKADIQIVFFKHKFWLTAVCVWDC